MRTIKTNTHLVFKFNHRDWDRKSGEACQAFIAEMKHMIPSQFRFFDSAVNKWSVATEYAGIIKELRRKHFVDVS